MSHDYIDINITAATTAGAGEPVVITCICVFMLFFVDSGFVVTSRGVGARVCECINEWSWVRSPLEQIKCLFKC